MSDPKHPALDGAGSEPTLPAPDAGAFDGSGITLLLAVDQIVGGRYRVVRALDRGGMGQVFEVEHLALQSRHALKIYSPAGGSTPAAQFADRFVEEARLLVKVRHSHVVAVTDAGTIEIGGVSHPFYVMELLQGQSLKRRLIAGPVALDQALAIADQAARALEAVHAGGIIHRDLKPDNIFLTADDGVKVIDFGIAKVNREGAARTMAGLVIGTPAYMAPEQAAGKVVDVRADVYSLGAVLYEMLTGAPPFGQDDLMEIFHRQATQEPAAPRERNAAVSPTLNAVVLKAIARAPEARYGSMAELHAALTAACPEAGGATTTQVTAQLNAVPWKTVAVGALAVLLALVGFLVMALRKEDGRLAPKRPAVVLPSAPPSSVPAPSQPTAQPEAPKSASKGVKRRVRQVEQKKWVDPDVIPGAGAGGEPIRRRRAP